MASLDWPSADNKASLLGLLRELRLEIFKALFRGLTITVCDPTVDPKPVGHRTLVSICATCRALSVEATPVFHQLAISEVVTSECWDYMTQTEAFSSNDDWLPLVQNVFVSTENTNGHDLNALLGIFPGITTLTINLQSIGLILGDSFEGMERLFISQSTLILCSAATDEGKWPDYDPLSADEDWVWCLAIQRACTSSAFSFKLFYASISTTT